MKYLKLTSILLVIMLFIASCEKDTTEDLEINEESITPSAEFFSDTLKQVRNVLKFTNLSRNASSYYWNFGDGTTSVEENPEHAFTRRGIYQVSLEATSATGETDIFVRSIKIGRIWVDKFVLKKLGDINPETSGPWDDDKSGADVRISLTEYEYGQELSNVISFGDDILGENLPITIELPESDQIEITREEWGLTLFDNDPPLIDYSVREDMLFFILWPDSFDALEPNPDRNTIVFSNSNGLIELEVHYDIRL